MAKQQTGANAVTVWMIIFAALWLTATVFLVILYTGQEDLKTEMARAQSANRKLISSAQQNSVALVKEAREEGPTVVGLLEEARSKTAELASGDPADSAAAVQTKRDQILSTIRAEGGVPQPKSFDGISYHDALTRLYNAFKSEHELRVAAQDQATELQNQVTRMTEADTARQNDFEQKMKEASAKLTQCEDDRTASRGEREKTIQKLEQDLDQTRQRTTNELTTERQARLSSEQRLANLQERFVAQSEKMGDFASSPEKLVTARQADGQILTAVPGEDVVYINRGAKDTVTLGLQFAVYSADTGIPADGRGKAQLEVVTIFPTSAECKVLWKAPSAVLIEGDLIANPVYDPSKPPTFLVLGQFDLNRDGIMDREGAANVEALIANWGGKVTKELTPMTDFIVLGSPPRKPRSGEPTGQSDWDVYNQTVETARTMSVPVMTQNVFLNFLGYAGRTASR